jgi:hypothetical protein
MRQLSSFWLNFKIQILCIFNKVFKRNLEVKFVSLNSAIITKGNELGVFWGVRGCHKIIIENTITLVGNVEGFKFIYDGSFDTLFLTFYGTDRIYSETITIRSNSVDILTDFEHYLKLPDLRKVPLKNNDIFLNFNNSWTLNDKKVSFKSFEVTSQENVYVKTDINKVQLDEFYINKYKP